MLTLVLKSSISSALSAIKEQKDNVSCFEIRLDTFKEMTKEKLKPLVKALEGAPFILTLRMKEQGGSFYGTFDERQKRLLTYLPFMPTYVDLEYNTPAAHLQEIRKDFPKIKILHSYHDFEKTEEDLNALFNMAFPSKSADCYKLATFANSSLDALRMLIFTKEMAKRITFTGICMGELGTLTRILAPVVNSRFNFCSLDPESRTAPGQLSVSDLLRTYKVHKRSSSSQVFALIGNPVSQSPSHITHNKVFDKLSIDAIYVKILLEKEELSCFFELIRKLPIHGLSVTTPFKQLVQKYVDIQDERAIRTKSINTIYLKDHTVHGTTTDGIGAIKALKKRMDLKEAPLLVLGAGGACRSIVYEAISQGASVTILNRTGAKAKEIANEFGCIGLGFEDFSHKGIEKPKIIIQTTSVGMEDMNASPLRKECISQDVMVMDIITKPKLTKFLKDAKEKGCEIVFGYEMFVNQAVEQFALFFSKVLDEKKVSEILTEAYLEV